MMKYPDASIVVDPIHFSEFVDQNGLVCFQNQSGWRFHEDPQMTILRVSREVWLGIHDDSVPPNDLPANDQSLNNQSANGQPLTPDEQIVEHMKILVDQRHRRTQKRMPRFEAATDAECKQMLSDALERQIWDLRLEKGVFGDVVRRRDREIKIGSLFVKAETQRQQDRNKPHPKGFRIGRFYIPFYGI